MHGLTSGLRRDVLRPPSATADAQVYDTRPPTGFLADLPSGNLT